MVRASGSGGPGPRRRRSPRRRADDHCGAGATAARACEGLAERRPQPTSAPVPEVSTTGAPTRLGKPIAPRLQDPRPPPSRAAAKSGGGRSRSARLRRGRLKRDCLSKLQCRCECSGRNGHQPDKEHRQRHGTTRLQAGSRVPAESEVPRAGGRTECNSVGQSARHDEDARAAPFHIGVQGLWCSA